MANPFTLHWHARLVVLSLPTAKLEEARRRTQGLLRQRGFTAGAFERRADSDSHHVWSLPDNGLIKRFSPLLPEPLCLQLNATSFSRWQASWKPQVMAEYGTLTNACSRTWQSLAADAKRYIFLDTHCTGAIIRAINSTC